ncbi:MAG: hypothetical protein ACRC37_07765, partial [Lentisphaeria bacterium]
GLLIIRISELDKFSPRIIIDNDLSSGSESDIELILQDLRTHLQSKMARLELKNQLGKRQSYTIEVQWSEKND